MANRYKIPTLSRAERIRLDLGRVPLPKQTGGFHSHRLGNRLYDRKKGKAQLRREE